MPIERKASLCASHASYSEAVVLELLIAESIRSWQSSVINVASRSRAWQR